MRKRMLLSSMILLALVSLIVLAGCASVPKPVSADDCLVLIKSDFKNSTTIYMYRKYRLELSSGEKPIEVPVGMSSYVSIVVKSPSVLIESISSAVNDNGLTGNTTRQKANIPLPYKAGCAVVADFCFVQEMKYGETDRSLVSGLNLRKMEQYEKDALLQSLKDAKKLEGWSL